MNTRTWLSSRAMVILFLTIVAIASIAAAFMTYFFLRGYLGLEQVLPDWSFIGAFGLLLLALILVAVFWPRSKNGDVQSCK